MREEPRQQPAEIGIKTTSIGIRLAIRIRFHLHPDQLVAKQRGHHHRHNPGNEQCRTDDREQRAAELSGHALGKGHRDKARTGNQCTGEHGLRCSPESVTGRIETIHAHLQLHAHHFHRYDRIIHQ